MLICIQCLDSGICYYLETGSTVTSPCPYRTIRVSTDQIMTVTSSLITSIQYDTGDLTFQAYAEDFLKTGLVPIVSHMIQIQRRRTNYSRGSQ